MLPWKCHKEDVITLLTTDISSFETSTQSPGYVPFLKNKFTKFMGESALLPACNPLVESYRKRLTTSISLTQLVKSNEPSKNLVPGDVTSSHKHASHGKVIPKVLSPRRGNRIPGVIILICGRLS